jgi:hypothetical protein
MKWLPLKTKATQSVWMLGLLTQWHSNHITKDMKPLQQCSQNIPFQGHCLQLTHLVPSLIKQLPRKCLHLSTIMTRQLATWPLIQLQSAQCDCCYTAILTLEKWGSIIPVSKTLTLQVHLQLQSLWTFLKQYMFGCMCTVLHLLPPCLFNPARTICYLPHHVTQHQIPVFCY